MTHRVAGCEKEIGLVNDLLKRDYMNNSRNITTVIHVVSFCEYKAYPEFDSNIFKEMHTSLLKDRYQLANTMFAEETQ